jgi:hypothetical protein
MGVIPDIVNGLNDIKDPFAKWMLRILLSFLVIGLGLFITISLIDWSKNRHVKVGDSEFNIPEVEKSKPETLAVVRPLERSSIRQKNIRVKNSSVIPKAQLAQTNTRVDQVNTVAGSNYGVVGGTNNTINNNGIVPRKITEGELLPFLYSLPNRNVEIRFVSYGFADAEINSVKNQIVKLCKANGYNKIENTFRVKIGSETPEKIIFNYFPKDSVAEFHIPPASE